MSIAEREIIKRRSENHSSSMCCPTSFPPRGNLQTSAASGKQPLGNGISRLSTKLRGKVSEVVKFAGVVVVVVVFACHALPAASRKGGFHGFRFAAPSEQGLGGGDFTSYL